MTEMRDVKGLKREILEDMLVELGDEFDKNFERKAYFTKKWQPRANANARGGLLVVSGALRRSIKGTVTANGVRFVSAVAYAGVHNEGFSGQQHVGSHRRKGKNGKWQTVKAHTRNVKMPERRFVGDGERVRAIVRGIVTEKVKAFAAATAKRLGSN